MFVNVSDLELRHRSGGWSTVYSDGTTQFEIDVAGNDAGPDAEALRLAKEQVPHVPVLFRDAVAYISHFVDPARFGCKGEWELVGVEFGFPPYLPPTFSLQLGMPDDDSYGLWSVVFSPENNVTGRVSKYFPFVFSRTQI